MSKKERDNEGGPSKKQIVNMFSIVAVFVLALALALAALLRLIGGTSSLADILQSVGFLIAVSIIAINSWDVAKRFKSKGWFMAWCIAIIIVVVFIIVNLLKSL